MRLDLPNGLSVSGTWLRRCCRVALIARLALGGDPGASQVLAQAAPPAFDAQAMIAQRGEVWVRLRVHLYRNDACVGNYNAWERPVAPDAIYPELRRSVVQANQVLANLRIAWVDEATFGIPQASAPAWCPIRFLLDSVSLHCDSKALGWGAQPGRLAMRYPPGEAINLHIVEWVGSGNGQAQSLGGSAATFTIESMSPTLLIHEAMHLFGVPHPFENDGIDDTPVKRYTFDYNQDGDTKDYFTKTTCGGVGAESQRRSCWVIMDDANGGPHYVDYDGDCVNDYTYTSVGHPCASWVWQSNNIMDYSGYNDIYNAPALTAGQVAVAMANLAQHRAPQIAAVAPRCGPANAQVYPYPYGDDSLALAVFTGFSQNVLRHRLQVYTEAGRRIYDAGWVRDTVPDRLDVALDRRERTGRRRGKSLVAGQTYRVMLAVENACGDVDETSVDVEYPLRELSPAPVPRA